MPTTWNKCFRLCFQYLATVTPEILYTIEELVMMETYISYFHTSFYIQEIWNLAFNLSHVHIIGTNHCGDARRKAFKRRSTNQYVLCRHDYTERVITVGVSRSWYFDTCKIIYHKRACYDGNIYFLFPHKFLYSRNTKSCI